MSVKNALIEEYYEVVDAIENGDIAGLEEAIEELNEIKNVYKLDNLSRIEEEVGDLIFSVVNVSRILSIDAEEALTKTVTKFVERFSFIESTANSKGLNLDSMTLSEMDKLWDEVKKLKKIK